MTDATGSMKNRELPRIWEIRWKFPWYGYGMGMGTVINSISYISQLRQHCNIESRYSDSICLRSKHQKSASNEKTPSVGTCRCTEDFGFTGCQVSMGIPIGF